MVEEKNPVIEFIEMVINDCNCCLQSAGQQCQKNPFHLLIGSNNHLNLGGIILCLSSRAKIGMGLLEEKNPVHIIFHPSKTWHVCFGSFFLRDCFILKSIDWFCDKNPIGGDKG